VSSGLLTAEAAYLEMKMALWCEFLVISDFSLCAAVAEDEDVVPAHAFDLHGANVRAGWRRSARCGY
jgi:hypothetical protein